MRAEPFALSGRRRGGVDMTKEQTAKVSGADLSCGRASSIGCSCCSQYVVSVPCVCGRTRYSVFMFISPGGRARPPRGARGPRRAPPPESPAVPRPGAGAGRSLRPFRLSRRRAAVSGFCFCFAFSSCDFHSIAPRSTWNTAHTRRFKVQLLTPRPSLVRISATSLVTLCTTAHTRQTLSQHSRTSARAF